MFRSETKHETLKSERCRELKRWNNGRWVEGHSDRLDLIKFRFHRSHSLNCKAECNSTEKNDDCQFKYNEVPPVRPERWRGRQIRQMLCFYENDYEMITKMITKMSGGNVGPANTSLRPAIIIGFDCNEEHLSQWETLFIEFLLAQRVNLQRYVPGTYFSCREC